MTTYNKLFIGGDWVTPATDEFYELISASTEEPIGAVPAASEIDVDVAVSEARRAFEDPTGWATWEPVRRAEAIEELADQLELRADEMARRVAEQNGMPITIAKQLEGGFPLLVLRYYANLLRNTEFETRQPHLLGGTSTVRREPMGVVAAISPWNYPQTLASFKIAPALASGCTIVLKPSPETLLDAFLFAEAVAETSIPAGVVNVVPGGREVGAYLVGHPGVDKVAFTGSTTSGRLIAETCGRLLRPVTLELGGKSAAIVLDDADLNLEAIGERLFESLLVNNGQTCYLGTRVLAPHNRYHEVVDTLAAFVSSLPVGDALDPETMVGPMASALHRDRVEGFIEKGRGDGARIVTGGCHSGWDKGWFVTPTVFADVDNKSVLAQEEIFGPVLAVIRYRDVDDAVRIANDSRYGLGGTVWTSDPERGTAVARRIQTGTIGINRYLPDPSAPFGGVKDSGLGRELGPEGLNAYMNVKTIYS